jgi:hypothetical protein
MLQTSQARRMAIIQTGGRLRIVTPDFMTTPKGTLDRVSMPTTK